MNEIFLAPTWPFGFFINIYLLESVRNFKQLDNEFLHNVIDSYFHIDWNCKRGANYLSWCNTFIGSSPRVSDHDAFFDFVHLVIKILSLSEGFWGLRILFPPCMKGFFYKFTNIITYWVGWSIWGQRHTRCKVGLSSALL